MLSLLTSRRMIPVALLVSAALVLTGCGSSSKKDDTKSTKASPSASPSATTAADPCTYKAGSISDSVKVTGQFGKSSTATFAEPLKASSLQRSIITTGTGKTTVKGQELNTLLSAYIGSTGKALGSQAIPLTVDDPSVPPAFNAGIACVPIGSRVVVTVPASDLYGPSGNSSLGISGTDTIVIVTDVLGITKPLRPIAWTHGVPQVTFHGAKPPKVVLPKGKAPKALELKVLKKGHGAVVGSGDTVTVEYQGTSWKTRKIFDQSYGKAPASFATTGVVPGFGAAMVGQKVGTRLIVTIPQQFAYPAGSGSALAGQPLVFVIEIQKSVPAA
ncbi:MAG: hypothetical protein JWP74_2914 [Marmoricola sp.]|nr:hypothetical protein [Marmoricola sp.]